VDHIGVNLDLKSEFNVRDTNDKDLFIPNSLQLMVQEPSTDVNQLHTENRPKETTSEKNLKE